MSNEEQKKPKLKIRYEGFSDGSSATVSLQDATQQLLEQYAVMARSDDPHLRLRGKQLLAMASEDHAQTTEDLYTALPDMHRGRKALGGAKSGGDAAAEPHRQKWPEYQDYVNTLHGKNPRLSYADIKRRAATKFQVSEKTIHRHTTNPKTGK